MVWIFDTLSGCIGGGLLTCNNISGGLRRCKLLATLGLKFFSIFVYAPCNVLHHM